MKKMLGLAVLLAALCLALCVTARAAEETPATQEISGQVKASQLTDGANITLTGDTVLTLDADKSVTMLRSGDFSLTIQGSKTLTAETFIAGDVTVSSGTLAVGHLWGESMTVNGGEVRGEVDLMLTEEGYFQMPRCIALAGSLTVNDGRITVDGKDSGLNIGLRAGTIIVNDGQLDVRDCSSIAICAASFTVNGGEVRGIAEGTGIGNYDGIIGFEEDSAETGITYGPLGMTVNGGAVEARGTNPGTTREDGFSVGLAMETVNVLGGTLTAGGSVSAINSDKPIQLAPGAVIRVPAGGRAATEPVVMDQSSWGWSGYSILNADGTRATETTIQAPAAVAGFTDVHEGDYFAAAVQWAVDNGVTTGTTATTFSPKDTCTRGQVVTFLWRAMGKPAPKSDTNPFADVKTGDYYYQPILWAVEQGITNGTDASHFSPGQTCSKAHIITFLWRAEGKPGETGSGAWYEDAANWGKSKDLVSGSGAAFVPADDCPRADVVDYLYRDLAG